MKKNIEPEYLSMSTPNLAEEKVKRLLELFPSAVTETLVTDENGGQIVKRGINFDALRQELADDLIEGPKQRYQFTWPDKNRSIVLANRPTTSTLRPCRGESKDFDATGNLYIEGDNLEVLKLLRQSYLGKVKMIYIDPPYNTGKDFVYKDNFAAAKQEHLKASGQIDEEGNRLVQNLETNGRFHTDWLNMIYPRLMLARDLLTEDGVIFITR